VHVVIIGAGLVGRRAASFLIGEARPEVRGSHQQRAGSAPRVTLVGLEREPAANLASATAVGWRSTEAAAALATADIAIVATAARHQPAIASHLISLGIDAITTADDLDIVHELWGLGRAAEAAGTRLIVGAAYSPGVSSLLVRHLARDFDEITGIATAQFGTGGPACARQHHRAMGGTGQEVHNGELRAARGGTGRQLVWFPDPIGAADCYRAALPEPWLLHHAFPTVPRISSRQAATRRDRMTMRLPMLRPPHAEGLIGSVWAEVRGRQNGEVVHRSMAVNGSQATGAAVMTVALCNWLAESNRPGSEGSGFEGVGVSGEGRRSGVLSVAECGETSELLRVVSTGVRLWTYAGSQALPNSGVPAPQQIARKRFGHEKP